MVKGRASQAANRPSDGPYRRVGILVIVSVAIVVLLFGVNMIARGLGGNERRLAEAFIATLQQPYINGSVSLSNQSQMSSFAVEGDVKFINGQALQADTTITLGEGEEGAVEVPLDVRADLSDSGVYYLKASSLEKIARPLGELIPAINADILSIAEKTDGKWLKYEPNTSDSGSCMPAIMKQLQEDDAAAKEITRVYMSHRFIDVSSVDKKNESTQVYTVQLDNQAMAKFTEKIYQAKFVGEIDECDEVVAQMTASPQQPEVQPEQNQVQSAAVTLTVKDGMLVGIQSSQAAQSSVNSLSVTLDFKESEITMPQGETVSADSIQHEVKAIGEFIVEQQASQQAGAGSPMLQPQQ